MDSRNHAQGNISLIKLLHIDNKCLITILKIGFYISKSKLDYHFNFIGYGGLDHFKLFLELFSLT